jgi:hypothetical protein
MKVVRGVYPHKWVAVFDDGKRTNFGAVGYDDYTTSHDKERRRLYRIRHKTDLETGDPHKAGFLSRYILWGDSTDMDRNIAEYKRKYNL